MRVAVIGSAGYVGGELLRIVLQHPEVTECVATSRSQAGKPIAELHPGLVLITDARFSGATGAEAAKGADVVFLALEHGQSSELMGEVVDAGPGLIVDLAADFRIQDGRLNERYYGTHKSPALVHRFRYALADVVGNELEGATALAAPGCFATAAQLALYPLAVVPLTGTPAVFAVTGSSGAGVHPKPTTHHPARAHNLFAYSVMGHRHEGEILEQWRAWTGDGGASARLLAHAGPFVRGIYATLHATLATPVSREMIAKRYADAFAGRPFVRLVSAPPEITHAVGTNLALIHATASDDGREVQVMVAIDNLIKGAGGQAVQAMNLALGLDETAGLKLAGDVSMLNGKAWLPVYSQMPLIAVSGHGSWLVDDRGNEWLDAYGGHAVASTGHCHPQVVQAIKGQAATLIFYSTAVPHPLRERLADRIAERCPGDLSKVFFCNSGAEANENALGLARKVTGRQTIVSVAGGWHGRTAACLTVTDGPKYEAGARRAGMPLSIKVPFNDAAAMGALVDTEVAAVIMEPVQGLTGARDCSVAFLEAARKACDKAGAVLIFDEIQCGVGRLGAFTAAEAFGVTPDIITMAKGLASGVPIGAMVATSAMTKGLHIGDLGSTFGGGPIACAAALATLQVIDDESLMENVATVSTYLKAGAGRLRLPVQGQGLLLGLRMAKPAADIQKALFGHRVLTGTASDPAILRLLPPLTFSIGEADLLLDALQRVLR